MRTDRRAEPRLRLAVPVLVDGPWGLRRCLARDISAHGLFLETADRYEPGTVVKVIFALPDGTWEMTSRCEVRHVVRLRTREGPVEGIGLAFLATETDAEDLVGATRREHA